MPYEFPSKTGRGGVSDKKVNDILESFSDDFTRETYTFSGERLGVTMVTYGNTLNEVWPQVAKQLGLTVLAWAIAAGFVEVTDDRILASDEEVEKRNAKSTVSLEDLEALLKGDSSSSPQGGFVGQYL